MTTPPSAAGSMAPSSLRHCVTSLLNRIVAPSDASIQVANTALPTGDERRDDERDPEGPAMPDGPRPGCRRAAAPHGPHPLGEPPGGGGGGDSPSLPVGRGVGPTPSRRRAFVRQGVLGRAGPGGPDIHPSVRSRPVGCGVFRADFGAVPQGTPCRGRPRGAGILPLSPFQTMTYGRAAAACPSRARRRLDGPPLVVRFSGCGLDAGAGRMGAGWCGRAARPKRDRAARTRETPRWREEEPWNARLGGSPSSKS